MDRSDFEVLQRAVLPAFAPLLRKHPADPKCKAAELGFLLRAGWVVVGPLRGRGCSWCAPAGGARAKCGLEGVLHRDFWEHPSHLCPYSGGYLFLFPCSFRRQTRALVVLGPGAAHGCPPASATRDCGAHKHKNPGRDPKSHGGGPGRNCSRGARKAFLFRSPFYRGGLGNWGALGVGSRGGAGPKMPHPWCPAGRCRGHDLKRPQPRFWPLCWSR